MKKVSASQSGKIFLYSAGFLALITIPVVAQSPLGAWGFDDGSGTLAIDASGNGHSATLVNGATWTTGKIGGAVRVSAASRQYVSIPAINLSETKRVTVAFWAKRTYSTVGGHALFESTANMLSSTTGFGLFPDDAACQGIQATLNGDIGRTANCYSQPSSGAWHHIAVVFDKTQTAGNEVVLYIDGALRTPSRSLYAATNTNNFGNNRIYVFSQGGTSQFDSGSVDDLRIYSTALTSTQIQQIYNFGKTQIYRDVQVSVDGSGTMTTPSFTTSVNNELLVAFVAYDGPLGSAQMAKISGGGLTWTLRQRSNHQSGTAEIWSASAPSAPFTSTVTAQQGINGGYHGSLTVIGFTNASSIGVSGNTSAPSGAPDISLATVQSRSWVFATGNDWDNSIARTPVSGQVLVHQRVDTQVGDTYWVQATGAPSAVGGIVDIHDNAPVSDRWNYAAVAIVSSATQGTQTPSPTSLNFGNVTVSISASQNVTITNSGGTSVTVSAVSISGTGFSLASVTTPFTLAAGASKTLTATFAPTVTGSASGAITVTSNASNPNLSIPIRGMGISSTSHSVTLTWTASTPPVSGYNVYRSTTSNGPFSPVSTGLVTSTTYVDTAVVSGATYYYYATAVDSQGNESAPSNQAFATVP